jgi:hypothetical protein
LKGSPENFYDPDGLSPKIRLEVQEKVRGYYSQLSPQAEADIYLWLANRAYNSAEITAVAFGGILILGGLEGFTHVPGKKEGLISELGYNPPKNYEQADREMQCLGNVAQNCVLLWGGVGCPSKSNIKLVYDITRQRFIDWATRNNFIHKTPKDYFPIGNLGSGKNPMPGAYNIDIQPYSEVDVIARSEQLPFANRYFYQMHSINPYGFQPVNPETARVLQTRGFLFVSGQPWNKSMQISEEEAEAAGFRLIQQMPIITEHQFGNQQTTTGEIISPIHSITKIYQKVCPPQNK